MEDIEIFERIFGPDIHTYKGKKVHTKTNVLANDCIDIPQELKDIHQKLDFVPI